MTIMEKKSWIKKRIWIEIERKINTKTEVEKTKQTVIWEIKRIFGNHSYSKITRWYRNPQDVETISRFWIEMIPKSLWTRGQLKSCQTAHSATFKRNWLIDKFKSRFSKIKMNNWWTNVKLKMSAGYPKWNQIERWRFEIRAEIKTGIEKLEFENIKWNENVTGAWRFNGSS